MRLRHRVLIERVLGDAESGVHAVVGWLTLRFGWFEVATERQVTTQVRIWLTV